MYSNTSKLNIQIIVGSVLGASEYVAAELEAAIAEKGYSVRVHLQPDLGDIPLDDIWIICTSTTGAGDLPANIHTFADQLRDLDVSGVNYLVVGLGDRQYDTYCSAAKHFVDLLQQGGATLLQPPLLIDVAEHAVPEAVARPWMQAWLSTVQPANAQP